MRKLMVLAVAVLMSGIAMAAAHAEGAVHKLVIHVDQNDPAVMTLALNNAQNVSSYYHAQGDRAVIEIVAYGPGLKMLVDDESPVRNRIAAMSLEDPDIRFSACGNTLKKLGEKEGRDVPLVSEAVVVPAGVVRLMELQGAGYSYLRP